VAANPPALGSLSPIVAQITTTAGTGPIVLTGASSGRGGVFFKFDDVLDTGVTVAVVVEDDSGQKEAFFAQFQSPNTLVPQIMIISTNNNAKISWPDNGQRIVRLMLGVVPPVPPMYLPDVDPIVSLPGACLCPPLPVLPPPLPTMVHVPCDCPIHPTLWATCAGANTIAGLSVGGDELSPDGLSVTNSLSNPGTIYTCGESYVTGKYYFELEYRPGSYPSSQFWAGGIVNSVRVPVPVGVTYPGSDSLGVSVGWGTSQWGFIFNQPWPVTPSGLTAPNFGDWLGFAVDLDNKIFGVRNSTLGGSFNNFSLPSSIVDGTHPVLIAWASASNAFSPNMIVTLNVGVTPFIGAVPSGFLPWDPHVS
jgi:hypothetical protein